MLPNRLNSQLAQFELIFSRLFGHEEDCILIPRRWTSPAHFFSAWREWLCSLYSDPL